MDKKTKRKKIAVTGLSGFVGTNFSNYLHTFNPNVFELIDVKDDFFFDDKKLSFSLKNVDIIIHLAGASRSKKDDIYETNIDLTKKLIDALESNKQNPHVIFLSSIHEKRNDSYGKSKKESRKLLARWCKSNSAKYTGLVAPNVFGPFSKPFYNTVIATFSHQLITKKKPKIDEDRQISLLYVENLIKLFFKVIEESKFNSRYKVLPDVKIKVSQALAKLELYKESYIDKNIFPYLKDSFDTNLFNTFRSFIPDDERVKPLEIHKDDRGYFCEALKTNTKGQVFYSKTNKGITRGNHFHSRKIERFCVLEGRAEIAIRRVGGEKIIKFKINGSSPAIIDMPIWYTHNIKNISSKPLFAVFWTNEVFNEKNQDTYYEQV